jgi:hypothetical protein
MKATIADVEIVLKITVASDNPSFNREVAKEAADKHVRSAYGAAANEWTYWTTEKVAWDEYIVRYRK